MSDLTRREKRQERERASRLLKTELSGVPHSHTSRCIARKVIFAGWLFDRVRVASTGSTYLTFRKGEDHLTVRIGDHHPGFLKENEVCAGGRFVSPERLGSLLKRRDWHSQLADLRQAAMEWKRSERRARRV